VDWKPLPFCTLNDGRPDKWRPMSLLLPNIWTAFFDPTADLAARSKSIGIAPNWRSDAGFSPATAPEAAVLYARTFAIALSPLR